MHNENYTYTAIIYNTNTIKIQSYRYGASIARIYIKIFFSKTFYLNPDLDGLFLGLFTEGLFTDGVVA